MGFLNSQSIAIRGVGFKHRREQRRPTARNRNGALLSGADRSDGQGNVRTTARDTGRGIPADSLERVFERLYQVREEGEPRQGSGLGLAISKEFVELMGGKI